jgi:hypothetical protein
LGLKGCGADQYEYEKAIRDKNRRQKCTHMLGLG